MGCAAFKNRLRDPSFLFFIPDGCERLVFFLAHNVFEKRAHLSLFLHWMLYITSSKCAHKKKCVILICSNQFLVHLHSHVKWGHKIANDGTQMWYEIHFLNSLKNAYTFEFDSKYTNHIYIFLLLFLNTPYIIMLKCKQKNFKYFIRNTW